MHITYYHNTRCSKSRQGLELLRENGFDDIEIIEYLKTGFDEATLNTIIDRLEEPMHDLIRTNEKEYKANPFNTDERSEVISALIKEPKLFQRPLALTAKIAVIGRPPEKLITALMS